MARDTFNQEKHDQNDGYLSRLAEGAKSLPGIKQIRDAIGKKANDKANEEIYSGIKSSPADMAPPQLAQVYVDANKQVVEDGPQLENDTTEFTYPPGSPLEGFKENLNGVILPADPGKPTIVYFGGSDFDRGSDTYKDAIKNMAEEARRQGMGFAAFDYPSNANEEHIKAYVEHVTSHLEANGVPKNQQAYAGYSLGGFSAMQAAAQNPEAAGLHLTSTFSSVRQATKEGMKDELGKKAALVPKHQLSEVMDNVALADQIVQQQQQRVADGKQAMPVAMISSSHEQFGLANNKHMAPLADRFDDYPEQDSKLKIEQTDFGVPGDMDAQHAAMPTHWAQKDSFKAFTTSVNQHSQALAVGQNQGQQQQVNQPQVAQPQVAQPQVAQPQWNAPAQGPKASVRDMLSSHRNSQNSQANLNAVKADDPKPKVEEKADIDPSSLSFAEKKAKFQGPAKVADSLPANNTNPTPAISPAVKKSLH